jgi:hypothetical protein
MVQRSVFRATAFRIKKGCNRVNSSRYFFPYSLLACVLLSSLCIFHGRAEQLWGHSLYASILQTKLAVGLLHWSFLSGGCRLSVAPILLVLSCMFSRIFQVHVICCDTISIVRIMVWAAKTWLISKISVGYTTLNTPIPRWFSDIVISIMSPSPRLALYL